MAVSIEVCIPSRDGRVDDDVLGRVFAACDYAARRGVACEPTRIRDRYGVAVCRNRGVAGFLARDKTHLLFVDDDVKLPAPAIAELAAAAEANPGAVVSGSIPSIRINEAGEVTPYVQVKPVGAAAWSTQWFEGTIEAEAVGGGCMLIPRETFALLDFPWFRWPETYKPGVGVRAVTDDADFCERVRGAGGRILALGGVRCGHEKAIDVAILIRG